MTKIYTREEIKDDLIHGINKEIGICETLRCVYDIVYDMPNGEAKTQITEKLIDALHMAKKMGNRLTYYYETYHDKTGTWGEFLIPQNQHIINSLGRQRRKRI
jgi:hypothetical protein